MRTKRPVPPAQNVLRSRLRSAGSGAAGRRLAKGDQGGGSARPKADAGLANTRRAKPDSRPLD